MTPEQKKKTVRKLIASIACILLFTALAFAVFHRLGFHDLTREELQAFIESKGPVAPLIYVSISFLQVTLVPLPGAVTVLAGNYVFGPIPAFLYSYIGMMLGAMVAFLLGRAIGRPFVNWIAGDRDTAELWVNKLKGREKVIFFFMTHAVP